MSRWSFDVMTVSCNDHVLFVVIVVQRDEYSECVCEYVTLVVVGDDGVGGKTCTDGEYTV